jgi:hypothetical protein
MKCGFAVAIAGLLVLLAPAAAVCQTGRRGRVSGSTGNLDNPTSGIGQALPNFTGIVRGLDSKGLMLEQSDQNTMHLFCTRKTQYFDGSKKIKISGIKVGDRVSVEARLGPDGKPEAVNVRLDREKPA